AGLSRGYLNRPELTAEKFISAIPLPSPLTTEKIEKVPPLSRGVRGDRLSLYKTGDLARYLPDGTIEYIGRIDNQVKLRGFRIELGEIEAVINQHPAVQNTVVVAHEIKPGDKRLVAYLVCHSQKPNNEELRNFLQDKLPEYMIPSAFVILETFPLTPNGKINRWELKPPKDFGISQDSFVPPTTPVEKKLATIWCEILGVEKIGIHDNFFQIGGHSLLIVQLQTRLEEIFKSNLTVADLFKHPTIDTQAEIIEITSTTPTKKISIQPVSRQLNLPLSFNQQRLWFLDQLEKNSAAYNMLLPARLSGNLDLEVLQQAFTEIIRRHEVLRTSFQMVDGEAVQIISEEANFNLSVIDWREVAETNREQQIQEFAISEAQRSFDLSQNPLLRVTLLQLTDTEYVLIFVIHHIISDDWSSGIIIQELATLYNAFASGKRSPLSELSIQYADFAHWQQQYLQSDLFADQLRYWQQQLAEVPTVLALPTDRSRPQVQNFQGTTTMFELPSKLSDNIKQVSQSEEVTLFMMLLTGFQTLLYCYSQQQDFCIGSPIANRNSRETEGIIGFFVNTLVLRAELSGNPSFRELLQRVREVAIGAFANQDLPFEKLLEELNIERSLSHNPLFQVWFVLHNVPMPKLEMGGCRLEPLHFDSGLVRHDLRLGLWETPNGFAGSFQYKTDLFDAETINLMVKDLENIFSHLVANLDMRLNEILDIINASKKQQQIMEEQKLENKNRQKLKKMKRKSVL
ncbi:MAG: AMP-binding protein, partial [Okeania sp. SIO2F4]|uniref:condensation domain-containing protein n=1 Tax=Okeania sp. SIO2F4 TaxID=2607790 RepID=UPI00142A416B